MHYNSPRHKLQTNLANCLLTVFWVRRGRSDVTCIVKLTNARETMIVGRTPLSIGTTYILHKHHPLWYHAYYTALVFQKFLPTVVHLHWLSCIYCACMHTIYTSFNRYSMFAFAVRHALYTLHSLVVRLVWGIHRRRTWFTSCIYAYHPYTNYCILPCCKRSTQSQQGRSQDLENRRAQGVARAQSAPKFFGHAII